MFRKEIEDWVPPKESHPEYVSKKMIVVECIVFVLALLIVLAFLYLK